MTTNRRFFASVALALACAAVLPGCGGSAAPAPAAAATPPAKPLELGEVKARTMTIRASRPEAPLEPGKAIDVLMWVAFNAADPNPTAVRAWIGSEDGVGATKAVAELAPPTRRHHFKAAVAVPAPLPPDARLHVEIDDTTGSVQRASFDLKR
jgi:hypothetical protein